MLRLDPRSGDIMNLLRTHAGPVIAMLACSPAAYSQSNDTVTRQVVAAWEKRQENAQTIDASWQGRDTSLADNRPIPPGPGARRGPKVDETRPSAGRFAWDAKNELVRIEADIYIPNRDGGMSRLVSVGTYDGMVFKSYNFKSQQTELGDPPRIFPWKSKTYSTALSNIRCLPLRLIYRALDRINGSYLVAAPMFELVREETIDGRDCMLVRLRPVKLRAVNAQTGEQVLHPNAQIEEHYWLDKQRDFLPVRFTRTRARGNRLSAQVDFQYEESGRQFVPASWRIGYSFNGERQPGLVVHAFIMKVTTNQAIPLEQFRFDGYPKGMYILDDLSSQPNRDSETKE